MPEESDKDGPNESGILEANIGANFDHMLSMIEPHLNSNNDPLIKQSLRAEVMLINDELKLAKNVALATRRHALKRMLVKDMVLYQKELKELGLTLFPNRM